MLRVEHLYHDYEGKGNFVIEDISFDINKGEIFGFLGPSGSGKSTVQNIMIGLIKLQSGSVSYDEVNIEQVKKDFYNKIGVSFEQPNLYPNLTGEENLKYFAGLFSVQTISPMEILKKVGLEDSARKKQVSIQKE